jgi:hypothetical protein
MELQILKQKLIDSSKAINNIILQDNFETFVKIKNSLLEYIYKIDTNTYISESDLIKASAYNRVLYNIPFKNEQLMDQTMLVFQELSNFIDIEYWQKQNGDIV